MKDKINIAKILKDCPKGMELDCTMFGDVTFEGIKQDEYPIIVKIKEPSMVISLTENGCWNLFSSAKCVIFPKGKTTWEGFVPPYKFKDGDVVIPYLGNIAIISNKIGNKLYNTYCELFEFKNDTFIKNNTVIHPKRLATEEEKQKLFDEIKAKGYKWNSETKTLEKLVEPIFKAGNKIEKCGYRFTIAEVKDDYYLTKCGNKIPIDNQDDFSLVPNKFDITTLKPFESKVLVREKETNVWQPAFYGFFNQHNKRFYTTSTTWLMCIPYNEDTKHLTGTTNDCDDYYKTWEE